MNKISYILTAALLLLTASGCEKIAQQTLETTTKSGHLDAIALTIAPAGIILTDEQPSDTIQITGGNKGYKILQPKKLWIGNQEVDNDKNMVTIHIDSTLIIFTRTSEIYTKGSVQGTWLLTDSSEQKRCISLLAPNYYEGESWYNPAIDPDSLEQAYITGHYPDDWFQN